MTYLQQHVRSIAESVAFWVEQARSLVWYQTPANIPESLLDGIHRWFTDGHLNGVYLALDWQIEKGRDEQTALIYGSPMTGTQDRYSYLWLRDEVACLAGVPRAPGVDKDDRAVIYVLMMSQTAMVMLACMRLGAVHPVVLGGFASYELVLRIDDATPKLVLTASCGLEFDRVIKYKSLVDKALELAIHQSVHVMVWQRPQVLARLYPSRGLDWQDCLAAAESADPLPVASGDPLYIMYTSGAIGKPKGIICDNGGHVVAVRYAVRTIYGMQVGNVWWGTSDVGWVAGHSLIVYGPLMCSCTTIFYEGKPVRTLDAGTYWRVIEEHRVNSLFCAPTAIRTIHKEDLRGERVKRYGPSSLRHLFLAGRKFDSSTQHWLEEHIGRPVHDHWWQTEVGWLVAASCIGIAGHDLRAGSTNRAVPGYHVQVLDDEDRPLRANRQGTTVIALPLPPGCTRTLWGDYPRCLQAYLGNYPDYYHTGDGGYLDESGFAYIMRRTDDVIDISGYRLSTGEMEERVAQHQTVAECAVIGARDELKGHVPLGLVVFKDDAEIAAEQLQRELMALVREQIGALARFQRVVVVKRLPKTRSGRILRTVLRKIADGEDYAVPSIIDDPMIPGGIEVALRMCKAR